MEIVDGEWLRDAGAPTQNLTADELNRGRAQRIAEYRVRSAKNLVPGWRYGLWHKDKSGMLSYFGDFYVSDVDEKKARIYQIGHRGARYEKELDLKLLGFDNKNDGLESAEYLVEQIEKDKRGKTVERFTDEEELKFQRKLAVSRSITECFKRKDYDKNI
jgi:hypothetical protein